MPKLGAYKTSSIREMNVKDGDGTVNIYRKIVDHLNDYQNWNHNQVQRDGWG